MAIIGIDFDGTCVTHAFPEVGKEIGAASILKRLTDKGHQLILFTVRCDHDFKPESNLEEVTTIEGNFLTDALNWFKGHDIPLYGINKNPEQHSWTSSQKPYWHLLIDDTALGAPLILDYSISICPFIDWNVVELLLQNEGYL